MRKEDRVRMERARADEGSRREPRPPRGEREKAEIRNRDEEAHQPSNAQRQPGRLPLPE